MIYLSPAPLYHSAPQAAVNLAISKGAKVIVMERFDPEHYLQLLQQYKVTHTQLVPTMFSRMLKLPEEVRKKYDTSSLEIALLFLFYEVFGVITNLLGGLLVLCKILFGFRGSGGGRKFGGGHPIGEKYQGMNEEERQKFKEEWRQRCRIRSWKMDSKNDEKAE